MYCVMLVDDEPRSLEGMTLLIDWEAEGFRICAQCANGRQALALLPTAQPDLIVTDLYMPEMGGLDLMKAARQAGYTGQFMILSGHPEFSLAREAMSLGVAGYLLKPPDAQEAADTLREVRQALLVRQSMQPPSEAEPEASLAARIHEYIAAHFAQDISLGSMGQALNHNPAYLGRLFQREMGENFRPWLHAYRLDRAAERLRSEAISAYVIAGEVGYLKYAYFLEKFKQRFGMTPERYRKITP